MNTENLFRRVIREIPDYAGFFTVEEMANRTKELAQRSSRVRLVVVGYSRQGIPITAIEIGSGSRTAFLFGTPHPNEPIGAMMLDYLAQRLATDEEFLRWTNMRWILIQCSDPDGVKLNEGWFKGPYTPLNYARNFYRPPHHQQIEWSFPVEYKTLKFSSPLPETQAIMRVIEEEKPAFIYSLHNAGFGGAYYYVSEPCEPLYPLLREAATSQGIPLSLGEPETPYVKALSDAVYIMPSIYEQYDYLAKFTGKDPATIIKGGAGSLDYARRFIPNVFSLVTEVPYFYDARIEDKSETTITRKEAVLESVEIQRQMYKPIASAYERLQSYVSNNSPFAVAIAEYVRRTPSYLEAKEKWAITTKELERPATVAEVFDNRVVTRFYGLLTYGMFLRLCDEALARGSKGAEVMAIRNEVESLLLHHNEILENDLHYEVIPIKRLVAVQLLACLYVVKWLKERG